MAFNGHFTSVLSTYSMWHPSVDHSHVKLIHANKQIRKTSSYVQVSILDSVMGQPLSSKLFHFALVSLMVKAYPS